MMNSLENIKKKYEELTQTCNDRNYKIIELSATVERMRADVEKWKAEAARSKREAMEWEEKYSAVLARCIAVQTKLSEVLPYHEEKL